MTKENLAADQDQDDNTDQSGNDVVEMELVVDDSPSPKTEKTTQDHILERIQRRKAKQAKPTSQDKEDPPNTQALTRPNEKDFESLDDYQKALNDYEDKREQQVVAKTVAAMQKTQDSQYRQVAQSREAELRSKEYAEASAKLGVPDFNEVQDKAFDLIGDGLASSVIDNMPGDAGKILYYFGKNPDEAQNFRALFERNPTAATIRLGELKTKVKLQPKKTSAPEPDESLNKGVTGKGGSIQAQLDKLDKDFNADKIDAVSYGKKRRELNKALVEANNE